MTTSAGPSARAVSGAPASAALARLSEGNRRYVAARLEHGVEIGRQRAECAAEQHPFAVVLGCSDARVPPSLVFDQGPGALFTTRVAGNVASGPVLASIEYAVVQLGAPLVLVLGHTRCGAVGACISGGGAGDGHLRVLMDAICPAVAQARSLPGDLLDNATRANVAAVVDSIRSSEPVLAARVASGEVAVVGAIYDLDTGVVEILQ
jgi:carbonic anhydrase